MSAVCAKASTNELLEVCSLQETDHNRSQGHNQQPFKVCVVLEPILNQIGRSQETTAGHKEWCTDSANHTCGSTCRQSIKCMMDTCFPKVGVPQHTDKECTLPVGRVLDCLTLATELQQFSRTVGLFALPPTACAHTAAAFMTNKRAYRPEHYSIRQGPDDPDNAMAPAKTPSPVHKAGTCRPPSCTVRPCNRLFTVPKATQALCCSMRQRPT